MTTDAQGLKTDPAVRRALGDLSGGADTFTQRRVERIAMISVAFGSTMLGAQAFLNALGATAGGPGWQLGLSLVTFVPLGLMIVACMVGAFTKLTTRLFSVVFVVVLLSWPAATVGRPVDLDTEPWIWYLINVATTAAVLAFRLSLQVLWAFMVPLLYGLVRLWQLDFRQEQIVFVALDVAFALIFAGVVLTLAWMLRSAAASIDRTRERAVASYAAAAAADAAEKERVAVAALMHDSVLAALIATERATTPRERSLAATMAREALTRLANADREAEEGPDEPVPPASVAAAIAAAPAEFGITLAVEQEISESARTVPGRAARAIVLAATQAIANAVQHAGGEGLRVRLTGDATGIVVTVTDSGDGFDTDGVPADRLGIRASIVARVAAVAGHATITSDAAGTVVTITWGQRR